MIEIPTEKLEQIIFKKVIDDVIYSAFVFENFDYRYFDNNRLSLMLKLIKIFFDKYSKVPSKQVLELMLSKHIETQIKNDQSFSITTVQCMIEYDNAIGYDCSEIDEDFLKETILSHIQRQGLYYAMMDNITNIEKKTNVTEIVERFNAVTRIEFDTDSGLDYFSEYKQHLDEISAPESRLSTGFKHLDYLTAGGIPTIDRTLTLFMAQPGLGKSMLLTNLAVNFLKQNKRIIVITLEMSENMYATRIDAIISQEEINSIRLKTEKVEKTIENFSGLYQGADLIIKEYDAGVATCHTISSYLEKLKIKGIEFDVVIVDYVNLIKPIGKEIGLYEKGGQICKALRSMSRKFKVPFISVSQFNRGGYNTSEVSLEHTSESSGLNADADFIAGLWQGEGDMRACKLNMTILKNRYGGKVGKVISFFVDYNTLSLKEMEVNQNQADTENNIAPTENLLNSVFET